MYELILSGWVLISLTCTWIRAHSISMSAIISPNRGRISFFTVKQTRQILSSSSVFMGTGNSMFLALVPFDIQVLTAHVQGALRTNEKHYPCVPHFCFLLCCCCCWMETGISLAHYIAPIHCIYIILNTQLHKNKLRHKPSQCQRFEWFSLLEFMRIICI